VSEDWPTLEQLAAQEQDLVFEHFTNDDAWALGTAFVEVARQRGLSIVVRISRGGQVLFHAAMPGTTPDNDSWIARKVRVVARFGHSSLYMGQKARDAGARFEDYFDVPLEDYAFHGGGFPLTIRDVGVVGAVVVSGLPQLDDHALVTEVVGTYLAEEQQRPALREEDGASTLMQRVVDP
jgi:uncharacterized protein (UPF0303 family)